MAKTQLFNIINGVITFTTNAATVGGATSRETVKATLFPLDPLLPAQDLVQGTDFENGDYRVDGVGDASDTIRVYWPEAAQNVGGQLRVSIFTDLENPLDAQLHNFQSSGTNTPRQFQEQIQQIFSIFAQVVGTGGSLGDISLADTAITRDRLNELLAEVFDNPTFDVYGNWTGDEFLPDTVQQLFADVAVLASMVNSNVGLPTPLTPGFILQAITPLASQWTDPDALLQVLPSFISLFDRVGVNETNISNNDTDILNLQNNKYDDPSPAIVWTSANDGPGSGLNADVLDGFEQNSGAVADSIARRDGTGQLVVARATSGSRATREDQFTSMFTQDGSGIYHRKVNFVDLDVPAIDGNDVSSLITLPLLGQRHYFAVGFNDLSLLGAKSDDVVPILSGAFNGAPQEVYVANNGTGDVDAGELDVRCWYFDL
jgi:hypothetical protein